MGKKSLGFLLVFLLLCTSFTLICSEQIINAMLHDRSTAMQVENFAAAQIQSNIEERRNFIAEDVTIPTVNEVVQEAWNVNDRDVIGGIAIPDVGISLPVFEGITKAGLMVGAGTMKAGQIPGYGNYSLAGHHMKDSSLLFGPLINLAPGSYIYITDLEYVYRYEVTEKKIIHQSETEVLDEQDRPVITLITCNISGVHTNERLMVRGELKDLTERQLIADHPGGISYLSFIQLRQQQFPHTWLLWLAAIIIVSAILTGLGRLYVSR